MSPPELHRGTQPLPDCSVDEQHIAEPTAVRAWSEGRTIYLKLADGRIFGFPADRYRILSQATDDQLSRVQIELNGLALRWEVLDEDLTVPGVIAGRFQLPLPEQPRGADE